MMTTVDQQKIRRHRTGLTAYDPALAYDGYTLFAPMFGDGTVYLIVPPSASLRGECAS